MNLLKQSFIKAIVIFLIFTLICGVLYTGFITVAAQVLFPHQANGSLIEQGGTIYGSELMGQQFKADDHMWGRVMNLDVVTYQDANGTPLMYATPSNQSVTSDDYDQQIKERIQKIRAAHPDHGNAPIPVDLVSCSGSGLDPHISLAAANYQISRIAKAKGITQQQVEEIIAACTTPRILGIFGEETVNVLKVNLMLDGILAQ